MIRRVSANIGFFHRGISAIRNGLCRKILTWFFCAEARQKHKTLLLNFRFSILPEVLNDLSYRQMTSKGILGTQRIKRRSEKGDNPMSRVDLLVLDEVGVQMYSQYEKVILHQVNDRRTAMLKPVGILTNQKEAELTQAIGERALDRLRMGSGLWVNFDWRSYRMNT